MQVLLLDEVGGASSDRGVGSVIGGLKIFLCAVARWSPINVLIRTTGVGDLVWALAEDPLAFVKGCGMVVSIYWCSSVGTEYPQLDDRRIALVSFVSHICHMLGQYDHISTFLQRSDP